MTHLADLKHSKMQKLRHYKVVPEYFYSDQTPAVKSLQHGLLLLVGVNLQTGMMNKQDRVA